MMARSPQFKDVKVEFFYPFKIAGWRPLRQHITNLLAEKDLLTPFDGATVTGSFADTMAAKTSSCSLSDNLRFMETLSFSVNRLKNKDDNLLWATCHSHEKRGTRPYCVKDEPFMMLCYKGDEVELLNPECVPDFQACLSDAKLRIRPTVKLLYSGFGMLTIKCRVLSPEAVMEAVSDIVYAGLPDSGARKTSMARELNDQVIEAIKYHDATVAVSVIEKYGLPEPETRELVSRIRRLVEEATVIKQPLGVDEIIDLQNLDRGSDWGFEPRFSWSGNGQSGARKLYHYFLCVLEKDVISRVKEAVAGNPDFPKRIEVAARLRHSTDWHAAEGEFPYVLTTVTAPDTWRLAGSAGLIETADYMKNRIHEDRAEIARLLMKSKWQSIRADWQPIKDALDNVFYSDLLYMAVHLRGALCAYYLPVDPEVEYRRSPELPGSLKYREEFKITLSDQRILWYIYTMHNQLISRDMSEISEHYEELRTESRDENFPEIFAGLSHIVTTIEDRKVALAEVMEDPLSRRGGSSLFAEMLDSSSRAFRLRELYDSLKHKLERLDMLGIHVSEGIHELSNLIVSESSRGAQITLEILESLIMGVYAAELSEFAAQAYQKSYHRTPYPLAEWWSMFLIGFSTFLVALPWVTLIRKFRTRVPVSEPPVQEWLESMFAAIGPIGLAVVAYLFIARSLTFDPIALLFAGAGAALLIGSRWWLSLLYERKVESINLLSKFSRYGFNRKS